MFPFRDLWGIRQLEAFLMQPGERVCRDCGETFRLLRMFFGRDDESTICGRCMMKRRPDLYPGALAKTDTTARR